MIVSDPLDHLRVRRRHSSRAGGTCSTRAQQNSVLASRSSSPDEVSLCGSDATSLFLRLYCISGSMPVGTLGNKYLMCCLPSSLLREEYSHPITTQHNTTQHVISDVVLSRLVSSHDTPEILLIRIVSLTGPQPQLGSIPHPAQRPSWKRGTIVAPPYDSHLRTPILCSISSVS